MHRGLKNRNKHKIQYLIFECNDNSKTGESSQIPTYLWRIWHFFFLNHVRLCLQTIVQTETWALLTTINCCIWRQIKITIESETKRIFSDSLNILHHNSVWSVIHPVPRRRKLPFLMRCGYKAYAWIRYTSNIVTATAAGLLSSLEMWRVVSKCSASCLFSEERETCRYALWISSRWFRSDVKSLWRWIPYVKYWYHI